MTKAKMALTASAFAFALGAMSGAASAMPLNGLSAGVAHQTVQAQQMRWVCGPYRCWSGPGPHWGPGPYWRGHYGYGWHRWHRW